MPNVNGMKFPYTAKGKADAKKAASMPGKPSRPDMNKPYPMPTVKPGRPIRPRPMGGTSRSMPTDDMSPKMGALRRMRGNKY
jgi:hypothetical protein